MVTAADREAARELTNRVRTTSGAESAEADRRAKDGRLARIFLAGLALRDDRGAVCAVLPTERDINKRLRIESEMRFTRLADDIPALLRL